MSEGSKPFPLLRLPIELHLSIFELMLPFNKEIIYYPFVGGGEAREDGWPGDKAEVLTCPITSCHRQPQPRALLRYLKGVGMVNRQIHAETNAALYSKAIFVVEISENTFMQECPNPNPWVFFDEDFIWRWQEPLRVLDLCRIKKLRIRFIPSDLPGVWRNGQECLKSLSRIIDQRTQGSGLNKLTIEITETSWTETDPDPFPCVQWPWELYDATEDDVLAILAPFQRFLRGVRQCDVLVPKWALESECECVRDAIQMTRELVCLTPAEWHEKDLEDDGMAVTSPDREDAAGGYEMEAQRLRAIDLIDYMALGDLERDQTVQDIPDDTTEIQIRLQRLQEYQDSRLREYGRYDKRKARYYWPRLGKYTEWDSYYLWGKSWLEHDDDYYYNPKYWTSPILKRTLVGDSWEDILEEDIFLGDTLLTREG